MNNAQGVVKQLVVLTEMLADLAEFVDWKPLWWEVAGNEDINFLTELRNLANMACLELEDGDFACPTVCYDEVAQRVEQLEVAISVLKSMVETDNA